MIQEPHMRTKKMRRRLTVGAALVVFGASAVGAGLAPTNGEVGWGQGETNVSTDETTQPDREESLEVGWV
jgi:hypothetical protein